MPIAPVPRSAPDDDHRMGSEYSSARSFRAQAPRPKVVRRDGTDEPHHGSNDSDFGQFDQKPD